LRVTRGGGGTFNNIWSPNTYAQSGFYVSDTTTPGHVFQLSVEHHLFSEIKLDRVENWDFNAPQTEEEAQTSPEAVAFENNASRNITIANYHAYRVTRSRQPFASAVRITNSSDPLTAPATSTWRTARSLSTMHPAGPPGGSMCPSDRCRSSSAVRIAVRSSSHPSRALQCDHPRAGRGGAVGIPRRPGVSWASFVGDHIVTAGAQCLARLACR
jgi:hypothetical protein